jgi:hypothetical protein
MRLPLAAIALFVIALQSGVAAQSWRELYERGDFEGAAAVLHALVLDPALSSDKIADVDAIETLARMYWDGKGVLQDRIVGCSFVQLALAEAGFGAQEPGDPRYVRIEQLKSATCGTLPEDDRVEAVQMLGCPRYGFDRQVFALDGGRSVEISRRGIRIDDGARQQSTPLPTTCLERVAIVRHSAVDPPAGAQPDVVPRHFIELYSWRPVSLRSPQRVLQWKLGEIVGSEIEWREMKELGQQGGAVWKDQEVPTDLSDIRLEMSPIGEVRWHFNDRQLEGTLSALPEARPEEPDNLPQPSSNGTARVDAAVVDRFGAPLAGALVKLTGVVDREALSDDAGAVSFPSLPAGRYDIVASAKTLSPSVVRVLDLSAADSIRVAMTLKPYAPTMMQTLACGGLDPRSLRMLAENASLVLHVKITAQETTDRAVSASDDHRGFTTSSRAQVHQSFKSNPLAPAASSVVAIHQEGGRIDRGEYIDHHSFNKLDPLNVGDEYVLFLYVDPSGRHTIHGSEEGAFRIRNGRVEPLGTGGAASAWRGRSVTKFFEALRAATP